MMIEEQTKTINATKRKNNMLVTVIVVLAIAAITGLAFYLTRDDNARINPDYESTNTDELPLN